MADYKEKVLTLKININLWKFLKHQSIQQELPMTKIIVDRLNKYKKKLEKEKKDVDNE